MRFSLIFLFFCWLFSGAAWAEAWDYNAFAQLPVQHDGRIKPLETFAKVHLERFYGASHIGDEPAIAWLAEVMFDPAKALGRPVFLVKDNDALAMLGLEQKSDHLYSFSETTQAIAANETLIRSLLQRPVDTLSTPQRAALELYDNTGLFTQITLSCTLFLRLNINLPEQERQRLGVKDETTFMDYYKYLPDIKNAMAAVARKGKDSEDYTPSEKQLALAAEQLSMTMRSSEENTLLRVIPPQWEKNDVWLSPWAVFYGGKGSPQTAKILQAWKAMARAYQEKDAPNWRQASLSLQQLSASAAGVRLPALSLENLYYRLDLLGKSMAFYAAGFVLALLSMLANRRRKLLRLLTIAVIVGGALAHAASVAARIYILERPPVGTLYESLLFVSLIGVVFGLILEWRLRSTIGLLVAAFTGSALLFASRNFSGDDTMGMLIAVLNTNFWLATHVLCITAGYGFGIAAATIAHIYLIMACLNRPVDKVRLVLRNAYGTALIALLFTSLGTILGGIWADQSWGRFWGWDPKENGALMICLWLIWLLHGRVSGRLHEPGFAVGLALLNVVIAISWLGVNLLSTGLHSYGFTDKAAWGLGVFCLVEGKFVAVAYLTLWRRRRALAG